MIKLRGIKDTVQVMKRKQNQRDNVKTMILIKGPKSMKKTTAGRKGEQIIKKRLKRSKQQ